MIALLARLALPQGLGRLLGYIGGAVLILALLYALWARGDRYRDKLLATQAALTATEANYRAAADQRKASDLLNVERVNTEAATISKETIDDYQTRVAALRADFAERVRIATAAHPSGASGTDLSVVSAATGSANACPAEAQFPAADALIASEQAEQLVALQSFITRALAIDVNGKP